MGIKEVGEKFQKGIKKLWFILWQDNSPKGWILSLIFLFIFVKFIFFPLLSFVTGTSLPLAIVESCSMYHQTSLLPTFDNWFERHEEKYNSFNVTKDHFSNSVLRNGFDKGDILFIIRASPEKLKIGDIILFNSGSKGNPVIHRIIKIQEENGKNIFTTIGDNNAKILTPQNNLAGVDERIITEDQLVGKAILKVTPLFGWVKLIFYEHLRPESERGFCKEN